MRLICPQCGAQYEVAAAAIPTMGRDVQCSNCGHTWFVSPDVARTSEPVVEASWDQSPDEPPSDATDGASRLIAAEDDEEADDIAVALADLAEPDQEPSPDPEPPMVVAASLPQPPRAPRSSVSPEVAEILREEAAREAQARAAEVSAQDAASSSRVPPQAVDPGRGGLVDDDDAGEESSVEGPALGDVDHEDLPHDADGQGASMPAADPPMRERQRAEEVRRRMARLRGEAAPITSAVVSSGPPARRDRLPDIEEFDSSLRSDPVRSGPGRQAQAVREAPRHGGFRLGFAGVLLVAAILALVYANAPRIMQAVPASATILAPYAVTVDRGRLWLEFRLRDVLRLVGGESAESAPTTSTEAAPAVLDGDPALAVPVE